MQLVRSWPAEIPEGRGYVVDDIPKFIMGGEGNREFDYRGLAALDDDVVLIEWDIAVGGEHLATFMARAKAEPDRVRVAPYLMYKQGARYAPKLTPFCCHRIRVGSVRRRAEPGDTHCQYFGFGLIYLPAELIRRFVAQMHSGAHFGDTEFSIWHMQNVTRDVPIDWDVSLVHLHYDLPKVPA